jgi:biopolymer transport protein TolQ
MIEVFISTAFAQSAAKSTAVDTSAWNALLQASPIVQATLLSLVFLSVVTWAVGFSKWKQLSQISRANIPFNRRFWKAQSLETIYEELSDFSLSNQAQVFKEAYLEIERMKSAKGNSQGHLSIENIERSLNKAIDQQIHLLEARLSWLATTGATGPFIGLFGTVWGIMGSFHKIGTTGNASLAVVAPGISEALIATAIGLAAAIPAVMMYNHFVSLIRRQEKDLNAFASDFLNVAKRSFIKE